MREDRLEFFLFFHLKRRIGVGGHSDHEGDSRFYSPRHRSNPGCECIAIKAKLISPPKEAKGQVKIDNRLDSTRRKNGHLEFRNGY